jgi:hypothetical protein
VIVKQSALDRFRSLLGNPYRRSWVIDPVMQYRMIATAGFFALIPILLLFFFGVRVSIAVTEGAAPVQEINAILAEFRLIWLYGLPVYACLFAYSTLRLSNRIAGPAYHIRRKMKEGRESGEYKRAHLRDGDHLSDLASEYNALVEKLEARRGSE